METIRRMLLYEIDIIAVVFITEIDIIAVVFITEIDIITVVFITEIDIIAVVFITEIDIIAVVFITEIDIIAVVFITEIDMILETINIFLLWPGGPELRNAVQGHKMSFFALRSLVQFTSYDEHNRTPYDYISGYVCFEIFRIDRCHMYSSRDSRWQY
ncbi:hypothetical protein QZH41_004892 [Actinostola sp. cb2023]|nr:hypothetical protein QZH41_004892 [Actinostola sp. cb2023]